MQKVMSLIKKSIANTARKAANMKKYKLLTVLSAIIIVLSGILILGYVTEKNREQTKDDMQQNTELEENLLGTEEHIQKMRKIEELQKILDAERENMQEKYKVLQEKQKELQEQIE